MSPRFFLLFASLVLSLPLRADIIPAPIFQDGAVLQREKPVPVWGRADPGEKVTVEFKGQKKEATAGADGRWQVKLDSLTPSAEPAEMKITGSNTVVLGNILVGDVWVCSGQSNMAWAVKNSKDPEKEIAEGHQPLIRHFKAALTAAATPQDTVKGSWEACTPETVGNFSATAYFFGRELAGELNVPIGLLNTSYGGTPVESWMSEKTLKENPVYPAVTARLKQDHDRYPARRKIYDDRLAAWTAKKEAAEKAGQRFAERAPRPPTEPSAVDRFTPSALYNAMVHPFLPAAVRGVIWFQGEANVYRSQEYAPLFTAMIKEWREAFGQKELPFYFVQMANQARESETSGVLLAFLREAQSAGLKLPQTAMVVSADIGDAHDSHFKNKQEAGRRLALAALAGTYGKSLEFSGPAVREISKTGEGYRITFDHAEGLTLKGEGGFELAGNDKVFHPANASLDGNVVAVTSGQVPDPIAVRYAWRNNPEMTLYNAAGLPSPAFRSDDWLPPGSGEGQEDNAE